MSSAASSDFSRSFFQTVGDWAHHETGLFVPQVCMRDDTVARQTVPGSILRLAGGGWAVVPLTSGIQKRGGEIVYTVKFAAGGAGKFIKATALTDTATHILPGVLALNIDPRVNDKAGANASTLRLAKTDEPVRLSYELDASGKLSLLKAVDGGITQRSGDLDSIIAPGELNLDFVPLASEEIAPPKPDISEVAGRAIDVGGWVTAAAADILRQRELERSTSTEEAERRIADTEQTELRELEAAVEERVLEALEGLGVLASDTELNTVHWLATVAAYVAGAPAWAELATLAAADREGRVQWRVISMFLNQYESFVDAGAGDALATQLRKADLPSFETMHDIYARLVIALPYGSCSGISALALLRYPIS